MPLLHSFANTATLDASVLLATCTPYTVSDVGCVVGPKATLPLNLEGKEVATDRSLGP